MNITVKCPNCYQQISKDNRFCIFCGYDLSGAVSASADERPAPGKPDPIASDPVPYDGPRFCPRGHDVPDPSLGFCPTCGSPLVDDPSASAEPVHAEEPVSTEEPADQKDEAETFTSRKCRCGYVCDDPNLNFCPACGVPFGSASAGKEPGWICSCGQENPADMSFCSECGKPREWKPPVEESPKNLDNPYVPDGMKPPADSDLEKKATYNP